eukprot:scaffold136707_cov27-Tisochrysis_lutea.AAC.3
MPRRASRLSRSLCCHEHPTLLAITWHVRTCVLRISLISSGSEWALASTLEMTGIRGSVMVMLERTWKK